MFDIAVQIIHNIFANEIFLCVYVVENYLVTVLGRYIS